MYVKPGDNIELSLNTEEFDETVKYKGSEASNFLAKKYLIREQFNFYSKDFYLGSTEDYNLALKDYKSSILQASNSISDTAFVNKQSNEIDREINYFTDSKEEFMTSYEADVREFIFEKVNLTNEKYNWNAIIDTMNIEGFNEIIAEYENNIKLLIEKLVKSDESISKKLEQFEDDIKYNRERKLSIINQPQNGESYIDFTYENTAGEACIIVFI